MALESNPSTDATQTQQPMVRLNGVSKTFPGGNQAVRDVNLDILEGEVFTLLGPSGCGKTTTLRLIAGLEEPDHGAIYFRDEAMVDTEQGTFVRANKRSVGMVFQSYAIWPHMTVEENVAYPLKLRGVPRAEIRERVSGALDLVGMPGVEKRPAPLLSGGQQQRVAWRGPSSTNRPSSCWTSRSATSTRSSATRCASRSSCCSTGSRSP